MITLDFETYYAKDYTLSKMTTEAYIRDSRFKCHGVGLKFDDQPAKFYHPSVLNRPEVRHAIENEAVLCHHAHFDGLILSHHFGLRPRLWLDTISMARLVLPHARSHSLGKLAEQLGIGRKKIEVIAAVMGYRDLSLEQFENLGVYCESDCDMTYELFQRMAPSVPAEEYALINATVRMFTEPTLHLNAPRLRAYNDAVKQEKATALQRLGVTVEMVRSNEIMAQLLDYLGVEAPMKPSPTNPIKYCDCVLERLNSAVSKYPTEGQDPAQLADPDCFLCAGEGLLDNMVYAFSKTDDGMRELLDHDNPTVAALAEVRLDSKSTLTESRCDRLLDAYTRGPLPVYLNYAGAHTLRWSGGDKVNWQNLPTKTFNLDGTAKTGAEQKGEIRESVVAPDGFVIGVGDSSQIECRMLNTVAGQWDIVEAFRQGRDIYSEGASKFYGRLVTKENKPERWLGKRMELGCGYGIGWFKFQTQCRVGDPSGMRVILDDQTAKNAVGSYRLNHQQVVKLWRDADAILQMLHDRTENFAWGPMVVHCGRIYGPGGSYLDYTNLQCRPGPKRDRWYTVDRFGKHARMYGPKLIENVVQWLSRLVLGSAMLRIQGRGIHVASCTHDEVITLLPELQAQGGMAIIMEELKRPLPWLPELPLEADGGFAREYSK